MKRKRIILFIIIFSFISCRVVAAKEKAKKGRSEKIASQMVTDWQGKAFGLEIPQWVIEAILGNNEDARKQLDLPDSAKVFFAWGRQEELKDALVLSKIECFEEIMKNAVIKIEYSPDQFKSDLGYTKTATSFINSIRTYYTINIIEENGQEGYSMSKESYTPFGYHHLFIEHGQVISEIITEYVVIPAWLDEDKWVNSYGWFCNPQNVLVEQFWIEREDSYYEAITAMSITGADWERILQELLETIMEE